MSNLLVVAAYKHERTMCIRKTVCFLRPYIYCSHIYSMCTYAAMVMCKTLIITHFGTFLLWNELMHAWWRVQGGQPPGCFSTTIADCLVYNKIEF